MNPPHTTVLLHQVEGPINLGSVCRAMANTGFSRLAYTGDLARDDFQARRFALHATDLLEQARHAGAFQELVSGTDVLFGFSPRQPWPDGRNLNLDQFQTRYREAQEEGRSIGLLFGNEAHGLANQHLAHCSYRVALPTHEDYPSLNLSHAVMVVLWECHRHARKDRPMPAAPKPAAPMPAVPMPAAPKPAAPEPAAPVPAAPVPAATQPERAEAVEKEALIQNLREYLGEIDFLNPQNPDHLWMEILPIFKVRDWTKREITLLLAIFGKGMSRYKALKKRLKARENPDE